MVNGNYPAGMGVAPAQPKRGLLRYLIPILTLVIMVYLLIAIYIPDYFSVTPILYSLNGWVVGFLDSLVVGLTAGKSTTFASFFQIGDVGFSDILGPNITLFIFALVVLTYSIYASFKQNLRAYRLYFGIGIFASSLVILSSFVPTLMIYLSGKAAAMMLAGLFIVIGVLIWYFVKQGTWKTVGGLLVVMGIFTLFFVFLGAISFGGEKELSGYFNSFGGLIIGGVGFYFGLILIIKNFMKAFAGIFSAGDKTVSFGKILFASIAEIFLSVLGLAMAITGFFFFNSSLGTISMLPGLSFLSEISSFVWVSFIILASISILVVVLLWKARTSKPAELLPSGAAPAPGGASAAGIPAERPMTEAEARARMGLPPA